MIIIIIIYIFISNLFFVGILKYYRKLKWFQTKNDWNQTSRSEPADYS